MIVHSYVCDAETVLSAQQYCDPVWLWTAGAVVLLSPRGPVKTRYKSVFHFHNIMLVLLVLLTAKHQSQELFKKDVSKIKKSLDILIYLSSVYLYSVFIPLICILQQPSFPCPLPLTVFSDLLCGFTASCCLAEVFHAQAEDGVSVSARWTETHERDVWLWHLAFNTAAGQELCQNSVCGLRVWSLSSLG